MQIVIDIPDEKYDRLVYQDIISLRSYVENGTVLPKGHGRLIDADKFQKDDYLEMRYGYDFYREFQSRLKRQLTVVEADKAESEDTEDVAALSE